MSRIPLTELVVSVIAENRQVLDALKEVEAAKKRALETNDNSGLQRELEQLGRTATEANRKLDPLAGQARWLKVTRYWLWAEGRGPRLIGG